MIHIYNSLQKSLAILVGLGTQGNWGRKLKVRRKVEENPCWQVVWLGQRELERQKEDFATGFEETSRPTAADHTVSTSAWRIDRPWDGVWPTFWVFRITKTLKKVQVCPEKGSPQSAIRPQLLSPPATVLTCSCFLLLSSCFLRSCCVAVLYHTARYLPSSSPHDTFIPLGLDTRLNSTSLLALVF